MRGSWDRSKGRPEPIRALNRVREVENGEPLVLLTDVAPSLGPVRDTTIPYVRRTVAEMVEKAAQAMPKGVTLVVRDAWRPIERQALIYRWMTECVLEVWPDIKYPALRRKVNRWVAPVDQKAPPGHCTGAAIDVDLVDEAGEKIDVTSPLTGMAANPTYAYGLSEGAQRNRDLLVTTMLDVGFSNCRDEYWHYSYGDAGWAVRLGFDECPYGVAHLPEELYKEQQRLWEQRWSDRTNPFLPSEG